MKPDNELKELLAFLAITAIIICIFLTFYFGLAGLKVFAGIMLASLPFYIFLNNINLAQGEKFALSLVLGITLFPSFAYLLGFFMSFRMSIAIVFIILTAISALLAYMKSRKS